MAGNPPNTVQDDATQALLRVRGAFGAVLAELPGPTERPREIERLLSVDKTLAWRLNKLIREPDIVLAAQHLPMSGAIETFLEAAASRGASSTAIRDARDAFGAFEQVVQAHAGQRGLLDMMLSSASPGAHQRALLAQRKSAFQANSLIWGVQARVQFSVFFIHPSDDDKLVDIASVRGRLGLLRVRDDVTWLIGRTRCVDDDGTLRVPGELSPLDPQPPREDGLPAVPLLRDFCSNPLPDVRRVLGPANFLEDELAEGPAGNQGMVTCVTGEVARRVAPRYRDEQNATAEMDVGVRTPSERLHIDVFIHRDLEPKATPQLTVYSDLFPAVVNTLRPKRDVLHMPAEVVKLNAEPAAIFTPQLPRHGELVAHVCRRLDWTQTDFVLYRVMIEYPVLPSAVSLRWGLEEEP
jgi:hypothetical protein